MSKVRSDNYTDRSGTGAPSFPHGANVTGVVTATSFTGDVTGDVTGNATGLTGTPSVTVATVSAAVVNTTGDVSIGGSLTVNGEMTTINSVELNIEDKLVGIAMMKMED